MSARSILAIEMCLLLDPSSYLHGHLKMLLSDRSERLSYQQKWEMYQSAAGALLTNEAAWSRGCWDFFDDNARAQNDFRMWVNGMLTEEGARKQPSGIGSPYRGEMRYLTFTMACLLVQGTHAERTMANLCTVPQAMLWQRRTFRRILEGLRWLNFAAIEADTMYLIPGTVDWALTQADLEDPKFQYLRQIV